jgi:hypothetical protein
MTLCVAIFIIRFCSLQCVRHVISIEGLAMLVDQVLFDSSMLVDRRSPLRTVVN